MRVFIGWDSRFPEPARVLAYSLRQHTNVPLDIRYLDQRHLKECFGFDRPADPLASTEFTYTRFLVPRLCDYEGMALFLDNDMLCLGDLRELTPWSRALLQDAALWVVPNDHQPTDATKMYGCPQTQYPRKNWSSLMLMDCEKLKCWTMDRVRTASGSQLHRFEDIPDEKIGFLPLEWNHLDRYEPGVSRLVHWTSGGVWSDPRRTWPHQDLWLKWRERWQKAGCP